MIYLSNSDWLALGAIILSGISLIGTFIYNYKALNIAEISAKASLKSAEAQEDAVRNALDMYKLDQLKRD